MHCCEELDTGQQQKGRRQKQTKRVYGSRGGEAVEDRLRAEGGCIYEERSAGRKVVQWLVLLMLCTASGAESGDSSQRQALAGGREGSWAATLGVSAGVVVAGSSRQGVQ